MTKPVTIPNTFATATTAIPLSQLDSDFSTVATALNDANTYSNYAADTGVANAYVVTLSGVSTTYSAGLRIQFKAGAANTGASTLNVNSGGTKNITFQDASALSSGTIAANAIVDVMYDGTQFLLMNDPAGTVGTGDVVGPASAVDNQIVLFNSTTGKLVKAATTTGLLKATTGVIAAAASGTDYAPATSGTSILKGNGSGGFSNAAAGTDYAAATTGTSSQLLGSNGSGGFSNVTVGSGLTYSAGTLSASGGSGGLSWQSVQTTGFTAVSNRAYPCNTTSAAFTVTLPASPTAGDLITLTDYAGTFSTNNLTVNPNGGKINSSTSNVVYITARQSIQFVYVDSTQGWIVYAAVNTPLSTPTVDYLVVAGGGGGGYGNGGGGGGGGFRTATGFSVAAGSSITVTVGGGGAAGTGPSTRGASGSDSVFSTITSTGGGGGGSNGTTTGLNGGSAGGGGGVAGTGGTGNTPTTSPSQGSNGGNAASSGSPNYYGGGGGGGGASAAGANGSTTNPGAAGNGGAGTASSYSGSSVTYAGGGGGGAWQLQPSTAGTGGAGGGGNGSNANGVAGSAGTTNLGGGGGGGSDYYGAQNGGAGGSGVVIIRYSDTYAAATSTTGSPTITVSGGYRIYKWTGNGSITF